MPVPNVNSEVESDAPAYTQELRFLRRGVLEAREQFCLYPVESNLRGADRATALAGLEDFLADAGMCLRVLTLTGEQWDIIALLEAIPPFASNEAALILGLDDTPEIVPVLGPIARRPPALSVLNPQRERVESLLPVPTIFWCESAAYRALIEHAPDFFDHYTATFHLTKSYPEGEGNDSAIESGSVAEEGATSQAASARPSASPALLDFYERQLLKNAESPAERAGILVGLAEELWRQPTGDIPQQKERGLQLAGEAAAIYFEADLLSKHAHALNIQGNLLQDLPSGDRDANLHRAISCCEAALRVRTEADFPQNWAATQNNLANAYSYLPSGDRDANLHRAISCCEAALRVYTESAFPQDWAATNRNLGIVYRDMGQPNKALSAWNNSVSGYRTVGLDGEAENVATDIVALRSRQKVPSVFSVMRSFLFHQKADASAPDSADDADGLAGPKQ